MQQQNERTSRRTLDPVVVLQTPFPDEGKPSELGSGASRSNISSVCFLSRCTSYSATDSEQDEGTGNRDGGDSGGSNNDSDSSSEDGDELEFRCRNLVQGEKQNDDDVTAQARATALALSLRKLLIGSCHANGDAYLWDLNERRILQPFSINRGPGLVMRRLDDRQDGDDAMAQSLNQTPACVLFHTRDTEGIVSLHDLHAADATQVRSYAEFKTFSRTFCAAAPCAKNPHLIALPSEDESYATVRDVRSPATASPVSYVHGSGSLGTNVCTSNTGSSSLRKYGMLTSLAMSESGSGSYRPILACGMESGNVFFHDLRMPGIQCHEYTTLSDMKSCFISLSRDPVLALDMAPSCGGGTSSGSIVRSIVAVAGMAGDAADLSELPISERGTVGLIKAVVEEEGDLRARLRARLATCRQAMGDHDVATAGKPGVSVCRFRSDGRIFAIGGWDRRLRIFDRSIKASPLATLRGHTASVNAIDWAPNATTSGLLATGSSDGQIFIWRCFSKTE